MKKFMNKIQSFAERAKIVLTNNGNEVINESERTILDIIDKDAHITIPLIAHEAKFSKAKIDRPIKELKEKKLLTRTGSNKTGHWAINKNS